MRRTEPLRHGHLPGLVSEKKQRDLIRLPCRHQRRTAEPLLPARTGGKRRRLSGIQCGPACEALW